MNTTGTAEVAVRHILSDKVTGGVLKPKTRTITWTSAHYVVKRPPSGKHTVELTCTECSASLLAEVRDQSSTRTLATIMRVVGVLCLIAFVTAFAYAIHEGGKTLPEGQSLPVLFPVSVVAIFVTFVAAPTFYVHGRNYNGVSMLDAPKPRRRHQIRPVRVVKRGPRTPR
ncbi:hypothetical protein [Streptomyces xylophagus]|uniref:hypothetical protein n=1 Tax=Streptomyces xylophagus TaxID=285514 RepID=UPI0005B7DE7A|nr:hypothetical protein [Streptomyces xylophagus]